MSPLTEIVLAVTLLQSGQQVDAKTPAQIVKFCELIMNPEKYDGLDIAVESLWRIGAEGSVLTTVPNSCGAAFDSRPFWEREIFVSLPEGKKLSASDENTKNSVALYTETLLHPKRQIGTWIVFVGKFSIDRKRVKSRLGDKVFGIMGVWPYVISVDRSFEI